MRAALLAAGLSLLPLAPRAFAATPTFTTDIAPILEAHCTGCHRRGGAAPFPLTTYEDARQRARQIAEVSARGSMPPWKNSRDDPPFVGQPRPDTAQLARLAAWAAAGAPAGGDVRGPARADAGAGWQLGTPDLVLTLPEPFILPADGGDVFRNFVLPANLAGARFVRGLELLPGSRVVHHVNIRVDATPASRERDAADPRPGYEGLLTRAAVFPDGHFLGWTPGQTAPLLPAGMAWTLEAGADLVLQMHLQPGGKPESIRPRIGLYFTDAAPSTPVTMLRLGRQDLDIAAGRASYVADDAYTLPVDVRLLALQPHAHQRARAVHAEAVLPDGRHRQLLDIADWDFRWQHVYRLVTPIALPRGTTLTWRVTWDNSAGNPRNPHQPPVAATWGQRTDEEMGDLWLQVGTDTAADLAALQRHFRPKAAAEDLVGYERLIQASPDDVGLRDDAAVLHLELGQPQQAARHWREVVRLQPDVATSRFNLATALSLAGDEAGAIAALEEAVRLNPRYARARLTLGRWRLRQGDAVNALRQFDAALTDQPGDAETHYQRGLALRLQGERDAAVGALRRAIALAPAHRLALMDLSWMLATDRGTSAGDLAAAVVYARTAVEISGGTDALALDVLGVALAADGQFEAALAATDAALALAPDSSLSAAVRQRQQLYRQGRPATR